MSEKQQKKESKPEVKQSVEKAEKVAAPAPRLRGHYREVVVPEVMKRFSLENIWQVPRLNKIVVNMGVGQGKEDAKYFDQMKEDMTKIVGQSPLVCRAKKSIAGFKIRKGQPIGLKVTLRHARMWEFLDRLNSIALPRIRDFRGLDNNAFDSNGSYNLGLTEHHIFIEIDLEKSPKAHGMNISFVMSRSPKEQTQATLQLLGMPFKKPVQAKAKGKVA